MPKVNAATAATNARIAAKKSGASREQIRAISTSSGNTSTNTPKSSPTTAPPPIAPSVVEPAETGTPVSTQTEINDTTDNSSETNADAYVPRYYAPETTITAPESIDKIQSRLRKDAQGRINSLRKYETTLLNEQATLNDKNERTVAAQNMLSGLAGSSEANIAASAASEKSRKGNEAIRTAVEVQVQDILSSLRKDAVAEAQAQRSNATADIAHEAARLELANNSIKTLASSGVTFEGLRTSSPKEFEHLARKFGSTEALKGAFVLNTPQEQILDKKIQGSKYIISRQNPLTGKVSVEVVDIPGLPPDYSQSVDLGDRIMFFDPSDPQGKQFFMPKGLTPSQAAGSGAGGSAGAYESDLDAIIGTTLSTIPTKFGQATFQGQMARARNDSDKINLIAAQVLKGQPSEVKNDFRNQAVGISELDKAIALIDSGVKSGALEAASQYTFNVVGRDFDPKLAQLNAHITSAIQPYRNSVTGAAWGTQEDGEYQQLFGSTKYSPPELRQRLVTVRDMLKNKSAQGLNVFVNPMGYYDSPFNTGAYSPSSSRILISPKGEQFDASDLTMDEYEAAIADGYSPQ